MSTTAILDRLDGQDLSRIAGNYLRIISDNTLSMSGDADGITFACAAAQLLETEAETLVELVTGGHTQPSMLPFHFAEFGFCVAIALLTNPPAQALEEIEAILEETKSDIKLTIVDGKLDRKNKNGKPA